MSAFPAYTVWAARTPPWFSDAFRFGGSYVDGFAGVGAIADCTWPVRRGWRGHLLWKILWEGAHRVRAHRPGLRRFDFFNEERVGEERVSFLDEAASGYHRDGLGHADGSQHRA